MWTTRSGDSDRMKVAVVPFMPFRTTLLKRRSAGANAGCEREEIPSIQSRNAKEFRILPRLAELDAMAYPASADLQVNDALAAAGTLEIIPGRVTGELLQLWRERVRERHPEELSEAAGRASPSIASI
jgi:hypothetical protein